MSKQLVRMGIRKN